MRARLIFQQFKTNTSGNVAIIFALAIVILAVAVGLAIDSSRAVYAKSKLQNALDAAALAAARQLENVEMSDTDLIAIATQYFSANMTKSGIEGLEFGELATTIDRAGSMVNVSVPVSLPSTFGGLAGMPEQIKFRPEAQTIFKSRKIEISLVVDISGSMADSGRIDGLKTAAKDLIDTLIATQPDAGAIRMALVPYSSSVNAGAFKNSVSDPSADTCVVERLGSEQSTDAGPADELLTSSDTDNPYYSCPVSPVEPLIDITDPLQRQHLKDKIDALTTDDGTAGHIGLAWGWYMLSPNWASIWPSHKRPRPASPDVIKSVIMMTDGNFNTSYGSVNRNIDNDLTAVESSFHQALTTCENIKDSGMPLYTIGFQAPTLALTMLEQCSGVTNFFDAANTSALIDAFREIAERLTSLRVSS
jgi:Flp pilus assembly protein TadG